MTSFSTSQMNTFKGFVAIDGVTGIIMNFKF